MKETKRKISKRLLGLLIAVGALTLIYVVFFFVLAFLMGDAGDSELNGIGGVLSYHVQGVGKLLSFTYGKPSELVYYDLGILLIAFPICYVIFLVVTAIIVERTKRPILWLTIGIIFLDLVIYAVFGSGSAKYFDIFGGKGVYEGKPAILALTICLLVAGLAHFVIAMIAYFLSAIEAYKSAEADESPEPEKPEKEETSVPEEKEQEGMAQNSMCVTLYRKGKRGVYLVQNFYRGEDTCDEEK